MLENNKHEHYIAVLHLYVVIASLHFFDILSTYFIYHYILSIHLSEHLLYNDNSCCIKQCFVMIWVSYSADRGLVNFERVVPAVQEAKQVYLKQPNLLLHYTLPWLIGAFKTQHEQHLH